MKSWHPPKPLLNEAVSARQAAVQSMNEEEAVLELGKALGSNHAVVFCFVSPGYDLEKLGPLLQSTFPTSCVVGCTTSGQIGGLGFQAQGITATALSGPFSAEPMIIEPLDEMAKSLQEVTESVRQRVATISKSEGAFGFLLIDGLSKLEERLTAALYAGVGRLPIIGGSAGDDLAFSQTHVLAEGRFRSNAAVLTFVRTRAAFTTIKVMHHVPSSKRMVITSAEPEERLVHEIDGKPAAEAYAEMVGVGISELGPEVFSKHPVILRLGEDSYIRSIQQTEGSSIRFYCAIEEGLVLSLAEPARVMESLEDAFSAVRSEIGEPSVVLGCDCILRRLELESLGLADDVGDFFATSKVVGFSTYGEQVDGIHVNQTFAGIALASS